MDIEYLQLLQKHSTRNFTDEGLDFKEITRLEHLFNGGNIFPKVLRELLFLAGQFCNFLDYNIYDSQQELQEEERAELFDLYGITIERPCFFVDLSSYGLPAFIF